MVDEVATEEKASTPAKVVEKVTMTDGKVVEFAGKRKLLKESIIDAEGTRVRLDFRNGQTRTFVIPADLKERFAAHGAEQKLGDATAGETDIDDMVLSVDDLIARLGKGEWNVVREGGGFAGTSILMQALVKLSGKTPEVVKAFLGSKTAAEKAALRASPSVKPVIDQIEAEKAAGSGVDTKALLGELGA